MDLFHHLSSQCLLMLMSKIQLIVLLKWWIYRDMERWKQYKGTNIAAKKLKYCYQRQLKCWCIKTWDLIKISLLQILPLFNQYNRMLDCTQIHFRSRPLWKLLTGLICYSTFLEPKIECQGWLQQSIRW